MHTLRPLLAILLLTSCVIADDVRTHVLTLVEQLDAETRAERQQATRALLALGPNALRHLPSDAELSSARVREVVRSVRAVLLKRSVDEAVRAGSVTLAGSFTLPELLTELQSRTGNVLTLDPEWQAAEDMTVEIEWQEHAYWDAVTDLERLVDAVTEPTATGFRLRPRKAGEVRPPAVTSGPFRLRIEQQDVRDFAILEGKQMLQLGVSVWNEPRLKGLFLFAPLRDAVLLSGTKRFGCFTPDAKLELPIPSGQAVRFQVPFLIDQTVDLPRCRLALGLRVMCAGRREPVTFRGLADDERGELVIGAERLAGEATVRLTDVTWPRKDADDAKNDPLRVTLSVVYPRGGPVFESHRLWLWGNDARVRVDETTIPASGFETELQTDGGAKVVYRFPLPTGVRSGVDVIYDVPTLVTTLPVAGVVPLAEQQPER